MKVERETSRARRAILVTLHVVRNVLAASMVLLLIGLADATVVGPISYYRAQSMARQALGASLVGKTDHDVGTVLGPPDLVRDQWQYYDGSSWKPGDGAMLERQWIYLAHPYLPAESGNYPRGAFLMVVFQKGRAHAILCGVDSKWKLFSLSGRAKSPCGVLAQGAPTPPAEPE